MTILSSSAAPFLPYGFRSFGLRVRAFPSPIFLAAVGQTVY